VQCNPEVARGGAQPLYSIDVAPSAAAGQAIPLYFRELAGAGESWRAASRWCSHRGKSSWKDDKVRNRKDNVPRTRDFKSTIRARAQRDPKFGSALLVGAAQAIIDGEPDVTKAVLRDYINATLGFERLSR
jgi:hypothetical protein